MPMSPHIKRLREHVGTDLLMLPGVAAVVRDADGRVLLHRRADDGHWSLPAGAIDPGETPATAVVREVHEETGLVVRPERVLGVFGWPRLRHRYPNGDLVEYLVVVFRCEIAGGTLEARDGESTGFRWCTRDELAALPLPYPPALFAPEAELTPVFDPPAS
ncbi:MAG TPA: NUDIX domain-containing protein [Kofleriaceae bacterium]|nr:NUDIX domain-containing protein [Kofleriaceae bacterium]